MIKTCTCKHEGQDKLHGNGRRVWNECKINNNVGYRCTVCGKETVSGDTPKKKGRK